MIRYHDCILHIDTHELVMRDFDYYDNGLSMNLINDDAEIIEHIIEIILSVSFILARMRAYIVMRDFDDFDDTEHMNIILMLVKNQMTGLLLVIMTSYSMFNVQSLIEQNFFFCLLCCLCASRLERGAREHEKLQN